MALLRSGQHTLTGVYALDALDTDAEVARFERHLSRCDSCAGEVRGFRETAARLARAVVALEVDSALAEQAEITLRKQGVVNVVVLQGPLAAGAPTHAPFDAILLNGSVAQAPLHLLEQLKERGRLVAVLAEGNFGGAQVWRRAGKGFDAVDVFDAGAEPLPGFARQAAFTL